MKTVIYCPRKASIRLPNGLNFSGNGARIRLKAGANHLSDEQVAYLKSRSDLTRYLDWGAFEFFEPVEEIEEPAGAVDYPPDLTKFNVDDAEDIIDQTWDTKILDQWRARDSRVGVFRAIDARKKQIEEGNG